MSTRRMKQASSLARTCSMKRLSAPARFGWPVQREWTPTVIIRAPYLLLAVELPVVRPAVAVAEHLVVAVSQPVAQRRIPLEGDRARADAHGDRVLVEHAGEPPHAHAAAELEVGLRPEVPPGRLDRGRVLAPGV